ncbi:MAG TPA: glucan biosynthesis protein [Methylomirabilota bacterium]|nr:glucan biosynthesis protein [Methylomirabilota bacterium]
MLTRRRLVAGALACASLASSARPVGAQAPEASLASVAQALAQRSEGADWRELAAGTRWAAAEAPTDGSPPGGVSIQTLPIAPPFDEASEAFVLGADGSSRRLETGGFDLRFGGPGAGAATQLRFRGATVFDLARSDQVFGTAARALAIRVADPRGEEIPVFRAVWIEPAVDGDGLAVHGLLDGPSSTAAVRLALDRRRPGVCDVEVSVHPRADMPSVGMAPLTCTYLHAPGDGRPADDRRPAVHDAEGLWMLNGAGERLWRPLSNPAQLQLSAFADRPPRAFGFVQRRRDLIHYLDLDAGFERRPSLLVEPVGDWGAGWVTLVEIPSRSEENDNIVVFWQPAEPLSAGQAHRFAYRLTATDEPSPGAASATVAAVRSGPATASDLEEARRYVVLYRMTGGGADAASAQASVRAGSAAVETVRVARISDDLVATEFVLRRSPGVSVDFRADLYFETGNPAEVLLHRWP